MVRFHTFLRFATPLFVGVIVVLFSELSTASADGHCRSVSDDFGMSPQACEDAHHNPTMGWGGAVVGLVSVGAAVVIGANASAIAGAGSSVLGNLGGGLGVGTGASDIDDVDLPPTDPWGNPLEIREDGRVFWNDGMGPDGDGWVTPEHAAELIAEAEADLARSDEWSDRFREAAEEERIASTANMRATNDQAVLDEAIANELRERLGNTLETIEESALRRGDLGVLLATSSDQLMNSDGTLNAELIAQLRRATAAGIKREQLSVESDIDALREFDLPGDDEYGDFRTRLTNHMITPFMWQVNQFGRNPLVRIGAGVASGGVSEIGFQSATAYEGIRAGEHEASALGIDYNMWDAARDGTNTVVDENLPVHTVRELGRIYDRVQNGEDVTLGDVARVGLGLFSDVGAIDTVSNIGGSARALGRGDVGSALNHGGTGMARLRDGLDRLPQSRVTIDSNGVRIDMPASTVGVSADADDAFTARADDSPLWRDPSDVDWQTGGPSLRSADELSDTVGDAATAGRNLDPVDPVQARMEDAMAANRNSLDPDVMARNDSFLAGVERGQQRVDDLREAAENLENALQSGDQAAIDAASERVSQSMRDIQTDKHAVNAIKNLPDDDIARNSFFRQRQQELHEDVITAARGEIADKFGVPANRVRTFSTTNAPTGAVDEAAEAAGDAASSVGRTVDDQNAAVARDIEGFGTARPGDGKVNHNPERVLDDVPPLDINEGVDLDVTYQVLDDNGRWIDVDHRDSGPLHWEELWKKTHPGEPIPSIAVLEENARNFDHAVTDHLIDEAYPGGYENLPTYLDDEFRHRDLIDPQGAGLAAELKGNEWFNRGDARLADLPSTDTEDGVAAFADALVGAEADKMEGTRQIVKQFDNLVEKRSAAMLAADNAPGLQVPTRLQEEVEILRNIGKEVNGDVFTVMDAERALQSMGSQGSLRGVAERLGRTIESTQVLRQGG